MNAIGFFCEDIREERSGQLTLIGLLPDNINVPPPPPDLLERNPNARPIIPRIALYLRIHIGLNEKVQPLKLKLVFADDSEVDLGDIGGDVIADAQRQAAEKNLPIAGIVTHAVFQALKAPREEVMRAILQSENESHVCAILRLVENKPS